MQIQGIRIHWIEWTDRTFYFIVYALSIKKLPFQIMNQYVTLLLH